MSFWHEWTVRSDPHSRSARLLARRIVCRLAVGASLGFIPLGEVALASPEVPSALLFSRQCSSCHTIGKGDLVGPDLKGVTGRRDRSWLLRFIRSSQEVVRSGDPTATRLFDRYKRQRMPDHDFTSAQIDALLEYVSTVKLEVAEARSAESASDADVRRGYDLFVGNAQLTNSPPCSACHGIRHPWTGWPAAMASFAPELSDVYDLYRDKPLVAFLRSGCLPRRRTASVGDALTPGESFALRAFLRDAARRPATAPAHARSVPLPR
jgi:mono/diheme cytochrome c family protein